MKASSERHGWVAGVRTASTHPPRGTFALPPLDLARVMADPKVSPRGLGSAIRMVQFYLNRAGRRLSSERRQALEEAKGILQAWHREGGKRS
ncbi:MAG: DUF3175 domain-containing protein [Candidatus Sericytochromatia bacterium]|nr:DUF3175 domain-containing protein [Candidatus Sericytochromatia bacterium]